MQGGLLVCSHGFGLEQGRVLDSLRTEYRRHRMARFTVWVLAYGAALGLVNRVSRAGAPGALEVLFWLAVTPCAFYYLVRFFKFLRRYLLWHLRRRLVLTYFFVAVVPIALLLVLVGFAAFFVNGQLASFLVVSRLQARANDLKQLGLLISSQGQHTARRSPKAALDELQDFTFSALGSRTRDYPALEVTLRIGDGVRAFHLRDRSPAAPAALPDWLTADEFGGIVLDHNSLYLRAVDRASAPSGPVAVTLSEPFTPELLDQIGQGIGPITAVSPKKTEKAPTAAGGNRRIKVTANENPNGDLETVSSRLLVVPAKASFYDLPVYNGDSLQPTLWQESKERKDADAAFFSVSSRMFALNRQILSSLGQYSSLYWTAFAVLGVIFLVIELVALVISWRLTRSITTTVDKLNEATERVKTGDFSHRINLPAHDQLTALGEAFDGMTASVERLLRESLEKTRLEGELEIAREVQNRLFPQSAPEVAGLELYGLCKPARTVSGDYYDFLRLDNGRVGLVVGDISGKGISAALLMATLQSALHAQFYDGHNGSAAPGSAETAEVVSRLNRQLYASTPREKYVTLFYGVYDSVTRKLAYTNAGHLPPVLFRQNRIKRLEGGGTVVGLFPSVRYTQAEIEIEPGDLLLAFTDGMTEPENSYGQEFGEERLLDVAQRARSSPPEVMMNEIYRAVSDWTGSPELQDDMTLVVAQAQNLA
ncbi:MAG TPA: SpoIIE family protein phosphatase [Terriglobia bacterium]|nr:SpoIIE family protein phosphatase [Terriglobia bacterium]